MTTVLTHVQLHPALVEGEFVRQTVDLTTVRLQGAALSERLVTLTALVGADTCGVNINITRKYRAKHGRSKY